MPALPSVFESPATTRHARRHDSERYADPLALPLLSLSLSQVDLFLGGERDYLQIKGETGPLVYPAGFLYVFSAIRYATGGGQVAIAQIIFGALYVANLAVVLAVYVAAGNVPVWSLGLLCLSRRYHSIFVLRLFNDCVAMLFGFVAVLLCQRSRLVWAAVAMSLGISVKMNLLLMLPGFLLLLVKGATLPRQLLALGAMAAVQVAVALPFVLAGQTPSYVAKAFEFSRVFIHHWTVNFKFVPEEIFVSSGFAKALLAAHLAALFAFASSRWCRRDGGVLAVVRKWGVSSAVSALPLIGVSIKVARGKALDQRTPLDPRFVADVLFGCNFVGIVFARSLHYQFYSWYFPTLVFLLFSARGIAVPLKVALYFLIEVAFNVFPSTPWSSLALTGCHLVLLLGYFMSDLEEAGPAMRRRRKKE